MLSTCADCGELTDATYCAEHRPKDNRGKNRRHAGYDAAWDRLSTRARKLQPFCSVPGCTSMDLTVDHTPEAWERKEQGKTIRLADVVVLCRSHNSRAGAARGDKTRGVGVDDPAAFALGRVPLTIKLDTSTLGGVL